MAFPFLLPALVGGGLGALTNRDDPLRGGLLGAGLGAGGAALGGLLAPAAVPAAGGTGAGGGLLATAAPEFGAAGLSQGAAAAALGGGALPVAAGETAALGLSQPAAAQALAPNTGPQVQEFFSKGFKNKLTTGLIDAAPAAAAALLRPGQQAPTAPAGQLNRPQFTPAQNLFLNFQRRRR